MKFFANFIFIFFFNLLFFDVCRARLRIFVFFFRQRDEECWKKLWKSHQKNPIIKLGYQINANILCTFKLNLMLNVRLNFFFHVISTITVVSSSLFDFSRSQPAFFQLHNIVECQFSVESSIMSKSNHLASSLDYRINRQTFFNYPPVCLSSCRHSSSALKVALKVFTAFEIKRLQIFNV